uniref:thiopurine S-methyltransferase n=1 Tax=Ditylum brightwellii TaxID=49249 RepID=A0A7S2EJL1_9STRA|mmetsp:Transcript_33070/g.49291  ORF Transcript_33070/g.49291 Transcript_33070/m.49291 type:complete len:310 (+) Transcript_33070:37-966(+)
MQSMLRGGLLSLLLLAVTNEYTTSTSIMSSSSQSIPEQPTSAVHPRDESSDVLQRWSKRWEGSDTPGWHLKDAHFMLLRYFPQLMEELKPSTTTTTCSDETSKSVRVLVPLCGKSVDLVYLAKHDAVSEVVGVDGIQKAIDIFMDENPDLYNKDEVLAQSSGKKNYFAKYEGKNIAMLKGDFFDLDQDAVDGSLFDVVWDRASMVAIKPEKREEYVKVLSQMIKPGGVIILCALDRRSGTEEAMAYGPPFSLPEEEILRLFEHQDWVESITKMEEHDEAITTPDAFKRWKDMGLTSLFEMLFVIRTKGA